MQGVFFSVLKELGAFMAFVAVSAFFLSALWTYMVRFLFLSLAPADECPFAAYPAIKVKGIARLSFFELITILNCYTLEQYAPFCYRWEDTGLFKAKNHMREKGFRPFPVRHRLKGKAAVPGGIGEGSSRPSL